MPDVQPVAAPEVPSPDQRPPGASGADATTDGSVHWHDISGKDLGAAPDSMQNGTPSPTPQAGGAAKKKFDPSAPYQSAAKFDPTAPVTAKKKFDPTSPYEAAQPQQPPPTEGLSQATGLSAGKSFGTDWKSKSWTGIPGIEEQKQFLDAVMGDVKNGTDNSWIGSVLRKMGAKGTSYGTPEALGTTMAGPVAGLPQAAHGLFEAASGHPIKGANEVISGAGTSLGMVGVAQPEALPFIAGASAGSKLASSVAGAMGADDDVKELVGNVAGLIAGGRTVTKAHLNAFETSVNTHIEAQNEYVGRIREHRVADEQAVEATKKAEIARAAEADHAKGNAQRADQGQVLDYAEGQRLRQETVAAQDNASAARANAKKARQALTEAEEAKNVTGYRMRQLSRDMSAPKSKPTPSKDLHDKVGSKEDYQSVVPSAKEGKKGHYDDNDLAVRDRYAEEAHLTKPINTVEDEHQMLQDSIESIDGKVKAAAEPYQSHPIATNPKMDVVDALSERESSRANWTERGLKSLQDDYNLTDPTIGESLKSIHDLNDELRNWEGKSSDPEYVAKSAAVKSLRNGVMQALEGLGVDGVGDMRSDMASLYKVRDAAYNSLGKGDKIIRGSGQSGVLRKALVVGGQAGIHSAGVGTGALLGNAVFPGAGGVVGGLVGEALVRDFAHNFGKKYGVADLTHNEVLQRRMDKTVSTGAIPEARGGNPNAALPGAEGIPVTRDATPLHADLASHYGQMMSNSTYKDLESRFLQDIQDKQAHSIPLEPSEKQLLVKINQQDSVDVATQKQAVQKAQIEAASKGQPLQPTATLPRNGVEPLDVPNLGNGMQTQEALAHEIVHDMVKRQTVGDDKLPSLGVRSHEHPFSVKRQANAVAAFDWSHYLDEDGNLDVNKAGGDIDDLAAMLVSGGVANDLWHDIPFTENHGLSLDMDILQKIMGDIGLSPEEQLQVVDRAGRRAKEIISQPGVREIVEQHAGTREPGLSSEMHFSPERLEQIHNDIEGNHEKASNAAGDAGRTTPTRKGNGAGGKGKVQEELAGPVGETRKGNAKGGSRPFEGAAALKSKSSEKLNPALSQQERDIGTLEPHSFGYMRPDGSIEQTNRFDNPDTAVHDDLARAKGDKMEDVLAKPGGVKYGTGEKRGFVKIENTDPKTIANAIKVMGSLPTEEVDFEFGQPGKTPIDFDGTTKQVIGKVRNHFAKPQEYELGEDFNPALSQSIPPERTTGVKEHDEAIKAAGGIPGGHLPAQSGMDAHALYHDPTSGSTLATPFAKLSRQEVTRNLQESRANYAPSRAVESAKTTGGFTFNPKTGEVPRTGYQVELFPEHRGFIKGEAPTTEEIRNFTAENQNLLNKHPELHVGGFGKELNVSGRFADQAKAEQAATKLDQTSIWDNKNGKEISTGGTGSNDQHFVNYPTEERLRDLGAAGKFTANEFNTERGRPPVDATPIAHSPETAKRIADAFDQAKHEPENPQVQKSYNSLKNDLNDQWNYATDKMGIHFEPWDKEGQPYATSKEMTADVSNNKHLYFFKGGDMPADHPLAGVDPQTGLTYNDKLRAVHDLFGHAENGFQFGPKGEENAWNVHRQMFSPESIPAVTAETRGQNSWVNFGQHLRDAQGNIPGKGEPGFVPPPERPFAQQKATILPEEFHQPAETPFAKPKLETNPQATPFAKPNLETPTKIPAEFAKMSPAEQFQQGIRNDAQDLSAAIPTNAKEELAAVQPELEAREARKAERQKELNRAFGEATKGEDFNPALSATSEGINLKTSKSSDSGNRVSAVDKDGKEVGFVEHHLWQPDEAVVTDSNLDDTYRGKGIGERMYRQAIEDARSQGAKRIYSDNITSSDADKMWKKLGAVENGKPGDGKPRFRLDLNNGEDLNPALSAHTLSTRVPSGVKSTEDALQGDPLHIGRAAVEASPEKLQDKFSQKAREIPGVKIPKNINDNAKIYDRFTDHVADNLKWLWNKTPKETREANRKWYESAHNLTKEVADQHGYTHPQIAGAVAAMSPQMDWDMNVDLGKRLVDIHKNHMNETVTPEMIKKGHEIVEESRKGKNKSANATLEETLPKIAGKKISDLQDIDRATAARLYDEVKNTREFPRIDPATGQAMETRTNVSGAPQDIAWGNFNNIAKALSILDDGSRENISNNVGDAHKVRNFYNNIIDPSDPNSVTVDTHAVNAATMLPMGGNLSKTMPLNKIVNDNFGAGGKALNTGVKGTYPLWADAYRKAAKDLGVLPRELQSVTWEKIRDMFPADWKSPGSQKAVAGEWKKYTDGKQSLDQTRNNILTMTDEAQKQIAASRAKAAVKASTTGRMNAFDFLKALRDTSTKPEEVPFGQDIEPEEDEGRQPGEEHHAGLATLGGR